MNKTKLITYVCLLIVMSGLLSGCITKKKKIIVQDIKSFYLRFDVGYYYEASYYYGLELKDDDKYIVQIKDPGKTIEEAREYEVTKEQVKELESLLNEFKVYKWDGFDKSDQNVLDGNSFGFNVTNKTGESISAHGYMMYPDNYREAKPKIIEWFDKIDTDKPNE